MDIREMLDREGRDAKNLLVLHFNDQDDANSNKSPTNTFRKPPVAPSKSPNTVAPCTPRKMVNGESRYNGKQSSGPRVRSASTGRDKKSELQARYWALLFGNLQRAVNEIYQTVECYENISSCQEAILVLENYVRDFKALGEWFKVSWDYENKPVQQRPQSLAWEVRKSNPAPRIRTRSLNSPSVSGKSSPCACHCLSGKSSPCNGLDNASPRKCLRVNVRELFSSSAPSSYRKRPNNEMAAENEQKKYPPAMQEAEPMVLDGRKHQYSQTDLEDDHLTLADVLEKMRQEQEQREANERVMLHQHQQQHCQQQQQQLPLTNGMAKSSVQSPESLEASSPDSDTNSVVVLHEPTAVELTIQKLNEMESEQLSKDARKEPVIKNENENVKREESVQVADRPPVPTSMGEIIKPPQTNGPLKYSSVVTSRAPLTRTNIRNNVKSSAALTGSNAPVSTKASSGPKAPFNSNTGLHRSATTTNLVKPSSASLSGRNFMPKAKSGSGPLRLAGKTEAMGPPTNVTNRLSTRSRTTLDINSNQAARMGVSQRNHFKARNQMADSSCKSSGEDIGSSSSTLKASNERINSSRNSLVNVAGPKERHSEPKQLPANEANDGWLTVKNRRRSSMHWANRFNQPTGYASLPTLALLNEKKTSEEAESEAGQNRTENSDDKTGGKSLAEKTKLAGQRMQKASEAKSKLNHRPEIKNAKAKVNTFLGARKTVVPGAVSGPTKAQPLMVSKTSRGSYVTNVPNRQTIIKRQKSDVTGLKMTSLHKEYLRSEKYAQRKQAETIDNDSPLDEDKRVHGDGVIEAGDLNKIDIKIQTNTDFSKTIGDLYESIALTAKAGIFSNGLLSSYDETEESLGTETECDDDQRLLVEEQESLERQIRELESTEIDVDTETDETDGEVVLGHDLVDCDGLHPLDDVSSRVFVPVSVDGLNLELHCQAWLSEMSWNEREEALATFRAYVSRYPGRAQELHQKLSSPSRPMDVESFQETLKRYQAKQARAQEKRERLQKEKADKIQQLLARVEDVKAATQHLIEEKAKRKMLEMEEKLQRAAENRELHLRQKIEKAHDEEKKLKEINFIKNIEAQNKRLDLIESSKETEGRLQDLEQERQKRLEEKAAKEAAVERRRQELEKERLRKLEKMNESRLEKEQRIGKMQEQKERQRQALAREKARDREERLLALQAQQQQTQEELQRKILQKQKESARRHEENIEQIRQRALELTQPLRNAEENGTQRSEDLNGSGDGGNGDGDGDLSSTVSDVGSREHTRGFKKKMKKLRQRLSNASEEYLKEMQPLQMHMKRESQVPKYLNLVSKGGGSQGLERVLGQLQRIMAKAQVIDFQCFLLLDGLGTLITSVVSPGTNQDSDISRRALVMAVQLYRNACTLCPQIARHALLGNSLIGLFDALFQSLQLPEEKSPQHPVELSTELMLACTVALAPSCAKKHTHPKVVERLPDLISYAVTIGLIEILSRRCMKIRESIENHQSVVLSLLATVGLLSKFIDVCPNGPSDPTRFLSAAKSTELFGTISMLNACVVPIGEVIPVRTVSLAAATFNLLVSMAVLDLAAFQEVFSSRPLMLKFLDVVTILLKYCGMSNPAARNNDASAAIIDMLASLGFLCANNKTNQNLLVSDQCNLIIKHLTKLPKEFHIVVYPCLVAIVYQNPEAREVVAREFNMKDLDDYSKSETAKKNHLIALLKTK